MLGYTFHPFYNDLSDDPTLENVISVFHCISYFCPLNPSFTDVMIQFGITFGCAVLLFIAFLYELVYYHYKHRFVMKTLYIIRFCTEVISPAFTIAASSAIGIGLNKFLETSEVPYLITCIFSVFSYLAYMATFSMGESLISSSCCLYKHSYSSFNSAPLTIFINCSSLTVLLTCIFSNFDEWTFIFLFIIHAIILASLIPPLASFVFHELIGTVVCVAAAASAVVTDIVSLVVTTFFSAPPVVLFVQPYIYFVVALPITIFLVLRTQKKILASLETENYQALSIEEKKDFYSSLPNLEQTNDILKTLRVAFMHRHPTFIDFSLPHYCFQANDSPEVIFQCMQLMSFFPSESRSVNILFSKAVSSRKIDYHQRFQIYQVNRIKTIRQSSVSSAANDRLVELKQMSQNAEDIVRSFWISHEPTIGYLELISSKLSIIESMWEEGLRDFPNNPKFADEFATFLCEGKADYERAIKMKYRSELVSNGVNFSIDRPFKALVKSYPEFLKEGILDNHGNVVKKNNTRRSNQSQVSQQSSSSGFTSNSSADEIEIDAELEESLGKQLFSQSKMRIALQRSIDSKSSTPIRVMVASSVICVIATLVIIAVMMVLITDEYTYQIDSSSRYSSMAEMNADNSIIMSLLLLKASSSSDLLTDIPTYDDDVSSNGNIFAVSSITETTTSYADSSSQYLNEFLELMSQMATQGYDIYSMASTLLSNENDITFCYSINGTTDKNNPLKTNLKNMHAYQTYSQLKMNNLEDPSTMIYQAEYCSLISSLQVYEDSSNKLFTTLVESQKDDSDHVNMHITIYSIISILAVIFISFLFALITYIIHLLQMRKLLKILSTVDSESKAGAMKSIIVDNSDSEAEKASEMSSPTSSCPLVIFLDIIFIALMIVFVVLMLIDAKDSLSQITNINNWIVQSSYRTIALLDAFHSTIATILLNVVSVNYTDQETYTKLADEAIADLNNANSLLLDGGEGYDSLFGFNSQLDSLNIIDPCTSESTDAHGIYKCLSTSKQLSVFKDLIMHIQTHLSDYQTLDNEIPAQLLHLVSCHLLDSLHQTNTLLEPMTSDVYSSMQTTLIAYLVCTIIVGILLLLFLTLFVPFTMKSQFKACMVLIKRLSPLDVMGNKKLMDYLLNRSARSNEHGMPVAQSVFHNSAEGIIGCSLNHIVEIVNPEITNTLGYTPEQLLGQPISTIFSDTDGPNIIKKLEMMKKGECSTTLEERVQCVADDASIISCHLTLLGMQKQDMSINSFVIIVRDESDLIKQQKEVEAAKASSEKLLFQILPRDIVVRINSGEKDITFSVPSATIIFIDIVKFSEYTSNLSPPEIMGNLSMIFAAYDQSISKYSQLTKIKLIGDDYMAAGGLFAPADQDPSQHATEMVNFALDCLHELEEINVKLNASLQVRIGINTGGPLIAGVLGTDRPVFDIIGDPINVAARLQSTDLPGRIQISQGTKDLLNEFEYQIDARGEVYLKGKGSSMTYFVEKANALMMLSQ